jgi:hypothetical protein
MIDQKRAEESAIACAVCFSMSLKEEGPRVGLPLVSDRRDYAWQRRGRKEAFNALFASAMLKYSKPSETIAKTPAIDS